LVERKEPLRLRLETEEEEEEEAGLATKGDDGREDAIASDRARVRFWAPQNTNVYTP
jgi:hypothetical protein